MTENATTLPIASSEMQRMVLGAFQSLEEDGTLENLVRAQVKQTMEGLIKESLREWSDFGKNLKAHLEEQVKVNFNALNLPTYNHILMQTIEQAFLDVAMDSGLAQVRDRIRELFGCDHPSTLKLSALVKGMRDEWDPETDGWDHKMTLHIDDRDHCIFIYMDPEERKEQYQCRFRIFLSRDRETKTMKVTSCEDKEDKSNGVQIGRCRKGIMASLIAAFMRGAEFEIDCDEDCEDLYFCND
jgi:hypothetical protein